MVELSEVELELMAEDITNSCRDIAERVETGDDGKEIILCRLCALYDQIAYKLIGIFLDDGDDLKEAVH